MAITLYTAAQAMQNKIALCADEDGIIDVAKLNEIEATFVDKVIGAAAYKMNVDATVAAIEAHIAAMKSKIESAKARSARMHEYIMDSMLAANINKVRSDDGTIDVALYLNRDELIELDVGAVFDESLCSPPKPRTTSKTLIKEAIKRGEPIKHARIVTKHRLTIK